MNGVAIILHLLANDAGVLALVDDTEVMAGVLPLSTPLPALSATSVSSVDENILKPGVKRRVTERVQVTGYGANYPSLKDVMKAAKRACADKMPTVTGASEIVVHTDAAGPDFMDENAAIYLGTQDFRVSFNELT